MGGKSGGSYRTPVEDPNTLQSQQEVTIIDVISEGPVVGLATDDAKSIALNFTPLMTEAGAYTFQNVAWDTREGTADQTAYADVAGAESELAVGVEVTKDFPRASGSGSGSASRTISNLNVTKVRVTLGVRGLYETIKDDQDRVGDTIGASVAYNIQISDKNGTVFINQNVTKNDKTTSSSQWKHIYSLASKEGPWTVKVSKTSEDNTDSAKVNNLYWESYTEIVGYKLIYPHTASILIKGTAETFGSNIPSRVYKYKGLILEVPSNYDPATRTYTGIWNGTFKNAWSDNPAWVLRDLIEHDRYGLKKRFPPAVQGNPLIDKWTLYEIAKLCDTMVADGFGGTEPRYTFNGQIMGSGEAVTVVQSIASVFHGMTYWGSGSLFTITDYPSDPIRTVAQVNVIDGIFTYSTGSNQERHSVAVVTWYDPDDFGRSSTEIVYDWEMMRQIGYREINVTAYGCYSRGQAYRQGLWTLLSEQEQWQVSFSMGLDGYDLMVGDRIKIADPTWMGARLSGRVKAISSDKRNITLDAPITLATGEEYHFNIISKAGTEETKKIIGISSDLQTITLESALTGSFVDLCVWSISGTDVSPRIFAIRNIQEEELGTITVSAYRVLTDKYSQLENNVRLEETPGRRASVGALPVPTGLNVIKGTYTDNGSVFQRLTFSWDSSGNPEIAYYQASYKSPSGSWNDFTPKLFFSLDIPAASVGVWEFRVRSLALDGRKSEWATSSYTLTGPSTVPLIPTNLTVTGALRALHVSWDIPVDPLIGYFEIWASETPEIEDAILVGKIYASDFNIMGLGILQVYWVWVRSVSLTDTGVMSDFAGPASGTTTAIAMEDVPENTISKSMLVDALAQKIDDTDEAIQIVEDVRMGEVNVFRQASAPTTGMITGDLWIDNTEVVHRYEGGEWVSKEGTPVYDLLKTAIAQYVVKTQTVTGDGQLKVAGFGLYNDSTTGSEFAVLADKFYVYAQKEDGSSYSNMQVFTVDATTTPPTVGINGNLIVDGSITGEKIFAESVIQLNTGGQLLIGANGLIQCGDGFSSDTVVISEGAVRIAQMIDGTYRARQVRTTNFASGQGAKTNQVVYIPGYFASPPIINVSINELKGYLASKGDQDQTWRVYASALTHESHDFGGGGNYSFTPVCQLILSSSIAVRQPNSSISGTTQWEWASASVLCPSTTTQLVMTGSVSSKKGTGSEPYYYKRAITCQLQASTNSGSTWTALGSAYQLTIQDFVSHAIAITVSSISKASDFLVRAYFTANNVAQNPTFDGGGTPFQYDASADITALNLGKLLCNGNLNLAQSESQALFTSQYSPPSGWTIYNVTTDITVDTYINKGRVTIAIGGHTIYNTSTDGRKDGTAIKGTFTFTTSEMSTLSSGTSSSNSTMQATTQKGSAGYQSAIEIKPGSKITFGLRKPNINSTTVDNSFEYKKVTLTLSSAESLADGYVNWTAFGS